MNDLRCIAYVSSAVQIPTQDEIDHLLRRARERNLESEVTGLLLYSDGSFMQFIEGADAAVSRIYSIILADSLHDRIISLMDERVREREFGDWSMAFDRASVPDFLRLRSARWQSRAGEPLGPGKELLRHVWGARRT